MSVGFRTPAGAAGFRSSSGAAGFRTASGGGTSGVPGYGKKKKKEEGFSVLGQHVPGSGILERAAEDIKDVAYGMPAGVYYMGRAGVHALEGHPEELGQMAKGVVTQMYADFRHPLRHPGLTLIDAMTIGSLGLGTAARFTEASRLMAAGKTAEATSVIMKGLRPAPRMVAYNGKEVEVGQLSRAGGMRTIQKSLDRLREQYPEAPIMGRSLQHRINFHLEQQARVEGARESAMASEMMRYKEPTRMARWTQKVVPGLQFTHRASTPEQEAVRLVGEQRSVAESIDYERRMIEAGHGSEKVHRRNIQILNLVQERGYLLENKVQGQVTQPRLVKQLNGFQVQKPDGTWTKVYKRERDAKGIMTRLQKQAVRYDYEIVPNPEFPKIVKMVDEARQVAHHREAKALAEGLLTDDEAYARKVAPLLEIRGKMPEIEAAVEVGAPAVKGQGRLFRMEQYESPEFAVANPQAMFRVPYVRYQTRGATRPIGTVRLGRGEQIGAKTKPGTFTHPFGAELLRAGSYRHDVMRLMAETDLEAQRYITMMAYKDKILQIAKPTPEGMKEPVAIRMESIAGTAMPEAIRALVQRAQTPGVTLSSDEILALGEAYDAVVQDLFRLDMTPAVGGKRGYMWIERDVVRPFLEPQMLSSMRQVASGGRVLKVADAANNGMRLGFLYLKPAYAIPNFLGNAALSLVQQGFLAPVNLAKSFMLHNRLSDLELAQLDAMMGEGMARAMASGGRAGLLGETTDVAARFWGGMVDTPFRRSAFLHEARRAGYTTLSDVKRLLKDKNKADEVNRIALEANKEIVDFARLGPFEANFLRRMVFFYPWLKGSSVQFARLLTEHPAKGLAISQLGEAGKQEAVRELGGQELPSYLEGYFPVGGTRQHPSMINPAAAAVYQTPGQLVETAFQTLKGNAPPGFTPFALANPLSEAGITTVTGVDPFTGQRVQRGLIDQVVDSMFTSMPAALLYQRLTEDQSQRMFPMTPNQAIGQFVAGGAFVPRTTSRARIYQARKRETQ